MPFRRPSPSSCARHGAALFALALGSLAAVVTDARPARATAPVAESLADDALIQSLRALPARHAIAMHGEPAQPADAPFPYANPSAPRGGRLVLGLQGTYDALNPLIVRGVAPDLLTRYVLQPLMMRSPDEPFTVYGLVAHRVRLPDDRSAVAFELDPAARFSDGRRLTSADVAFSFEMLKTKGKPFHRSALRRVKRVLTPDDTTIVFDLGTGADRELPLLLAGLPVFAKHATDAATFDQTTVAPFIGSGPYVFDEIKPGESASVRRNPDFWGRDLPLLRGHYNFDAVRYDFYRDSNTLFEAFKTGLIDVRFEGDPGRWNDGYDIPAVRQGRIVLESLPFSTPRGMNAFVFNARRGPLADARVRRALAGLLDFDWINRTLYAGAYRRTVSFFEGSELSAAGRPASPREREFLSRVGALAGEVSPDVLEGRPLAPLGDGSGRDRAQARTALALLAEAGFVLTEGEMRHRDSGAALAFEILVSSRPQERLALSYARSLARVGVRADIRLVDDIQYWRRLSRFDFDVIQWLWPVSASPGNEQANRWTTAAADREGSFNYPGIRSRAVDAAVDALLAARERDEFVDAVRTLDRLLISGSYVAPLFHLPEQWVARQRHIGRPEKTPLTGAMIDTWWRAAR